MSPSVAERCPLEVYRLYWRINMCKKILSCISLILVITSNIFSQSFKFSFSGRFEGKFIMLPSTYDHYKGYTYPNPSIVCLDFFDFNSECNWITIKLFPKPIQAIDTLKIDFKLGPFNYSDTSQYSVQFEDTIYYYPDSLSGDSWVSDIIGLKLIIPLLQNHFKDSLVINLQDIDWDNEASVELYFNTNFLIGSAGWQPVDIGNIWQYEVSEPNQNSFMEHYEVFDTLLTNDTLFYLFEKKEYKQGEWISIKIDSVFIDDENNILTKRGNEYWDHFNPFLLIYSGLSIQYSHFSESLACIMDARDNLPGTEFGLSYIYGIGLISSYSGYLDEPENLYQKTLLAAKISGTEYGNITTNTIFNNKSTELGNFIFNEPYPNPFNNRTTITYYINNPGFIDVSIYNIRGNCIDQLYIGYRNKGFNKIFWEADNYSSGIYFIVVRCNDIFKSRKVLLLK